MWYVLHVYYPSLRKQEWKLVKSVGLDATWSVNLLLAWESCAGGGCVSASIRNIPTLMAVKVEGEKRLIILD